MSAPRAELVDRLDAALPQTQCTRCGYPRCRAYAEALASGAADINQCPPGGEVTIRALAALLDQPAKALNPAHGENAPRAVARIDEQVCIGCRKCLDVCPVDAILGARKLMHSVLESECNGCGLCVPPCPVDCIVMTMVTPPTGAGPWPDYTLAEVAHWRARTQARLDRLARRKRTRPERSVFPDRGSIRADIAAALERARRKQAPKTGP